MSIKQLLEQRLVLQETLSNELIYLKKYMEMSDEDKAKERAYQNSWLFNDFAEENDIETNPDLEDYEQLEELDPKTLIQFGEYVKDHSQYQGSSEIQLFDIADFDSFVRNQWLVHFSDSASDIARSQKFSLGTDYYEYSRLGLSTHYTDASKKSGGFNFAYEDSDVDRYSIGRHGEPKYGSEAILFKGDGVKIQHYGDQEPQVIFDGKATNSPLIYIQNDSGEWYLESPKTGQVIYKADSVSKIADWVDKNYAQYRKHLETK